MRRRLTRGPGRAARRGRQRARGRRRRPRDRTWSLSGCGCPPSSRRSTARPGACASASRSRGPPRHLALDAAGGEFLVPAERADRFLRVRPDGTVRTDVLTGHWPHDAAAVAGRVFVGDERANTVSVIEGAQAHREVRGRDADRRARRRPIDGRLLAVVSVRERVLELYDPRTLRRVGRVPAGVGPTHVVANGDRLFVADTAGGALLVFRLRPSSSSCAASHLPGAPYGLAVDPVAQPAVRHAHRAQRARRARRSRPADPAAAVRRRRASPTASPSTQRPAASSSPGAPPACCSCWTRSASQAAGHREQPGGRAAASAPRSRTARSR